MRTTLDLDPELMATASALTGIKKKPELIHTALRSLIARESGRRLAAMGGSMPGLKMPRRRRSSMGSFDEPVQARPPAAGPHPPKRKGRSTLAGAAPSVR